MEPFQTDIPQNTVPARLPWYKTAAGTLFLGVLGLVGVGAVLFGGLIGYYTWQIKIGKGDVISQELQPEFSAAAAIDPLEESSLVIDNPDQYVRSYNPTRGETDAPLRIIMFIDFECPYCQKSYKTIERIADRYGNAVSFVFKHFPIDTIHPNAERAGMAAACAGDQDAFWEYYDLLFAKKLFDQNALLSYAQELDLDTANFAHCLDSAAHQEDLNQDLADGIDAGVRGTPTYIVNRVKVEGVLDEATWDELLIDQLRRIL